MKSIKEILSNFNPTEDKYVSREFQSFGVYLSEKLRDERRKALYIKMARDVPRPVLQEALRFVIDSNARNMAALFMWKLKELNAFGAGTGRRSSASRKKATPKKLAKAPKRL